MAARSRRPGARPPHVRDAGRGSYTLRERLGLIFDWYRGMVDRRTGRLLYVYDPGRDLAVGDGNLIRDIASIWGVEVLSDFLGRGVQRIDVTGHAASGFMKSLEVGIAGPAA